MRLFFFPSDDEEAQEEDSKDPQRRQILLKRGQPYKVGPRADRYKWSDKKYNSYK